MVENTDPKNFQVAPDRLGPDTLNLNDRQLFILAGTGRGNFRKTAESKGFLPSQNNDVQSCLADPLTQDGGLAIENGLLKIGLQYWYSCGSWYITCNTYTLRWQKARMQLIGFDSQNLHRPSGESSATSINFSTGKRKDVTGSNEFEGPAAPKTVWKTLKNRQPVYLEDLSEGTDFKDR